MINKKEKVKYTYFPLSKIDSFALSKTQLKENLQLNKNNLEIQKQEEKCLFLTHNSAKPPITPTSKAHAP